MKCQKCNESYTIFGMDKGSIGVCPKCGERIVPMPSTFESISEAIYYCIQVGSKEPFDILNNKTKLNSHLEDTLGSSYPERNMVKAAIDSDIGSVLFRAKESTNSAQKEAFDEAVDQMCRSYGTEINIARKTVKYFTDAMGWNIITEQPKPPVQTENQAAVSSTAARPSAVPPVNNANAGSQPPRQNAPVNQAVSNNGAANNNVQRRAQPSQPQQGFNNGYAQSPANEPKKKKKGCFIFFMVLIFLLLAALAFIIAKIFNSEDEKEDKTTDTTSSISQTTESISEITTENSSEIVVQETTEVIKAEPSSENNNAASENSVKTEAYSVRSLSGDIDINENRDGIFACNNYDIDTENNILYYALGDSIYKVNLNTGDSELYTKLKVFGNNPNSDSIAYVVYNQYNKKMYCVVSGYGDVGLYDISANEAVLLSELPVSVVNPKDVLAFTSENTFCVTDNSYDTVESLYEINLLDFSYKHGYVNRFLDYSYNQNGARISTNNYPFTRLLPILKNDNYYWLESDCLKEYNATAICYTMKSICNDEKDCGYFVCCLLNVISQCVTDNEAYIMTDDYSIYRIDVEKLLNYNRINIKFPEDNDYSDAMELIIDGKDIKQTGVNNIGEPMGLKMTKDGRFVIFDIFDNTFKIVENK